MGKRARDKKAVKKFKVGDYVTWGNKEIACPVVKVSKIGVYVKTEINGREIPEYFVPFEATPMYGTVVQVEQSS